MGWEKREGLMGVSGIIGEEGGGVTAEKPAEDRVRERIGGLSR